MLAVVIMSVFAPSTVAYAGLHNISSSSHLLAPGDHEETLKWGGLTRTYIVHVPPGPPKDGRSLILVYHGADSTATGTISSTDFEQAGNVSGEVVVFLQGYGDTWNEQTGHTPAALAHVNDVGFTGAVLNILRPLTGYNPNRVAATGISNGALFVQTLGCRLASRLYLIVPVEGEMASAISPTCAPSRPLNVLEVHATADSMIPYDGGNFSGVGGTVSVLSAPNSVRRWAVLDHCDLKPQTAKSTGVTLTNYVRCRDSVTVTLRTIIGGGHVWGSNIGQIVTAALKR